MQQFLDVGANIFIGYFGLIVNLFLESFDVSDANQQSEMADYFEDLKILIQ